ncbi:dihydrofolate reductase [Loigolactobacillus backii]|uniref:Dihydrofolate reductase n=1 Tax=Loigolactobacillus backii TaxID=375175 RepID=A0A192H2D1_9LACO|nr:dihydrofolate reductase [Loigolactobacillus backii]ANK62969.1 dihydrofolate reductase [Loigolactobacillus backii]ANK64463.1 dihydrofolate reductase [Loigolactobacillus backii]ANK67141.1 dihydrofolate reductase [Loigolactobacillus backii]ANK70023.1 dihydrofolate reductase [Loigolactobacillus backii]MDA5387001.1 dihydrofolate reductase [Loigolactobacillus backii]
MLAYMWAEDKNHLIGAKGALPWHLPADLKHFKDVTMGKPVIMGRKTFVGMEQALPNRLNIVLTRKKELTVPDGVMVLHSKQAVLDFADLHNDEEVMIIGGAKIFSLFADVVQRLYITRIDGAFSGDTYMPELNWKAFEMIDHFDGKVDQDNKYPYTFATYQRKS